MKRIKNLKLALEAIQKFGHGIGHGRGYSCANMAAKALEEDKEQNES